MPEAILFDGVEVDHLGSLSDRPRRLGGSKLLWVDVHHGEDADELAEIFDLDQHTSDFLESPDDAPVFQDFGRYIHITTYAPLDDEEA